VGSALAGNLLLVGSGILTARILGPEGKGAFAYAILLPSLALNLSMLGLGKSLVYFVAGRRHSAGVALGTSLVVVVPLAAGCALVLVTVGKWLASGDPGLDLVRITAWLMPPAAAYSLLRFAALGLQRYGAFNLLNVADKVAPLALYVIAVSVGGGDLRGFSTAYVMASAVSLVCGPRWATHARRWDTASGPRSAGSPRC
jgi:O-antigen/teichoic acid export membrane protein